MHRTLLIASALLLPLTLPAQTETDLLTIAQSGIGSNGFGTTWRGQDVELAEDGWLTRIAFQTGSATSQVDEIRLMTSGPRPTTLRATNAILTPSNTEVEGLLAEPFLLRAGTRYTIWFRQSGSPRGTSGCDLNRIPGGWLAYHTNVDPTLAPAAGESRVWWGYRYGTNCRLIGFDNLEITGSTQLGGTVTFTLEVQPNDLALVMFAAATTDQPLPGFFGPLRLAPATLIPPGFVGRADAGGRFANALMIPNDPNVVGLTIYVQGAYDATFATSATLSPLDALTIR